MVTIIDPHIKRDDGYYIYHEAKEKDFFIKNKHGHEYDGWCWPGSSSYLDFSNPATWNWWADNFALDKYQGTGRVYGQGPITYVKVTCLYENLFNVLLAFCQGLCIYARALLYKCLHFLTCS